MPKLSDTMTEGTIVKWRKQKGDKVAAGDTLAEIETDKATMEMESFDDGILAEIYVPEGEKVGIGQRIAMILAAGESAPAAGAAPSAPAPKAPAATPAPAPTASAPAPGSAPEKSAAAEAPASGNGGVRVKASPLAKKIAAEKGIDLVDGLCNVMCRARRLARLRCPGARPRRRHRLWRRRRCLRYRRGRGISAFR
jgi:pyruvate dehydrogenase E2 component (dihydrolipoamide acetyltransferase)